MAILPLQNNGTHPDLQKLLGFADRDVFMFEETF
jgi:hypothetical protein